MAILILSIWMLDAIFLSVLFWGGLLGYFRQRTLKLNIKFMTAKAALARHLLAGHILNIKNCFELIGLTNCPREISRMIEQPFGVTVTRMQREGKSRYGQAVTWFDYRLNKNLEENKEGVKKMIEYVKSNMEEPKTTSQVKEFKQIQLSLQ